MAITSAEEARGTGSIDREGRSGDVTYTVITDTVTDGPQTIITHFEDTATLPFINDTYIYQSESRSDMIVKRIKPTPNRDLPTKWDVVVTYGPKDEQNVEQEDISGNPSTDPTDWRPTLSTSFMFEEQVADEAEYVTGYDESEDFSSGKLLKARTGGIIPCDSAMNPFNPPPTQRVEIELWRIGVNTNNPLDKKDLLPSRLIREGWKIDLTKFLTNTTMIGNAFEVGAFEGKLLDVRVEFRVINGVEHWHLDYEWGIDRHRTWLPSYLDQGMDARARLGDPDGRGGTIGETDLEYGKPEKRALKDKEGHRLSDPVRLDGAGQPLPADGEDVYGTWDLRPALNADVSDFPILSSLSIIQAL